MVQFDRIGSGGWTIACASFKVGRKIICYPSDFVLLPICYTVLRWHKGNVLLFHFCTHLVERPLVVVHRLTPYWNPSGIHHTLRCLPFWPFQPPRWLPSSSTHHHRSRLSSMWTGFIWWGTLLLHSFILENGGHLFKVGLPSWLDLNLSCDVVHSPVNRNDHGKNTAKSVVAPEPLEKEQSCWSCY